MKIYTKYKLQLNDDKTEYLVMRQNKWGQTFICTFISVGCNVISFSTTAKNLQSYVRDDMRIDAHVQDICLKAYIDIRRISSIRHLLSIDAKIFIVSAFVLSISDYCNYLFYAS